MHSGVGRSETAHEVAISNSFGGAVCVFTLTLHPCLCNVSGKEVKAVFADQHLRERDVVGVVVNGCAFDDVGISALLESAVAVFEHFGGQFAV